MLVGVMVAVAGALPLSDARREAAERVGGEARSRFCSFSERVAGWWRVDEDNPMMILLDERVSVRWWREGGRRGRTRGHRESGAFDKECGDGRSESCEGGRRRCWV